MLAYQVVGGVCDAELGLQEKEQTCCCPEDASTADSFTHHRKELTSLVGGGAQREEVGLQLHHGGNQPSLKGLTLVGKSPICPLAVMTPKAVTCTVALHLRIFVRTFKGKWYCNWQWNAKQCPMIIKLAPLYIPSLAYFHAVVMQLTKETQTEGNQCARRASGDLQEEGGVGRESWPCY